MKLGGKMLWGLCWVARVLAADNVAVYEGVETIPTYKMGPGEKSPMFYTGRGVQGSEGRMYPYAAQTALTDTLSMEQYEMVYLENKYLKVTILPALGGKIFSAIDKTNGHELFHRNSTIKPTLIGTLGAWVSGGVEWCYPNHHRTTSMMPAAWRVVENADGSATVWTGETDRVTGLKSSVGVTLRPGRSYLEAAYRLGNPTTATRSFLFWANVAVTAGENFRTSWPPAQELGVFHSNTSFVHWPISHEIYNHIDYTRGVDLSWWKNHPLPVSIFFWKGRAGFIGGYDYGTRAGVVHVGNPHQSPTSKLFQFGPGTDAAAFRKKLTDDGKAYVELMTGTFSNNQPDFAWFAPHSVKEARNYWYPIRDLELLKAANLEAAATLQLRDPRTVFYGFNTTREHKRAKAVLRYEGVVVAEEEIEIGPADPHTARYESAEGLDESKLSVELLDAEGQRLIFYTVYQPQSPPLPREAERLLPPGRIESLEDLYLTGRHIELMSLPGMNAEDYYGEILRRSPRDHRANLAMGIRRVRQWRYEEARDYLMASADKLQVDYRQPKEGEIYYYLGLAQKGLGNFQEAYDAFYRATWYYEWASAGYYELALLEGLRGDHGSALDLVRKAYSTNNDNGEVGVLLSAQLRRAGKIEEASRVISHLLEFDPLNFAALNERMLLDGSGTLKDWFGNMQDIDNDVLTVVVQYADAGLPEEAIRVLEMLDHPANPLTMFYLSWLYYQTGDARAEATLRKSLGMTRDYCFPYRPQTEAVLRHAISHAERGALAHYLLGNLLYDRRPAEAMAEWRKAAELDGEDAMTWRNLAFGAFHHEHDAEAAIKLQREALERDDSHPSWLSELAIYHENARGDLQEILAFLESRRDRVMADIDAPKELARLYLAAGEYAKATELLDTHHFRTWEGGISIYDLYVNAHVFRALELERAGDAAGALRELEKARLFPENLEVGEITSGGRMALVYYWMGRMRQRHGDEAEAREFFRRTVATENEGLWLNMFWLDSRYYRGLAMRELGDEQGARECFADLKSTGEELTGQTVRGAGIGVEEDTRIGNRTRSRGYFLRGLAERGLGNPDVAQEMFQKAVDNDRNNLWAKYYLNDRQAENEAR